MIKTPPSAHRQIDTIQDDRQAEVFKLLANPATFNVAEVRRVDTHGARVFLAGDRVFKVKRAVRYPFLDYSTLGKREAACRAELEVNRNFAPQLYRRIVPITRENNGSLRLDGDGTPVEWAVEMMRFDENNTLDHLAERGELDDALADKLANAVAAMHERAPSADANAWIAALDRFVADNTAAFRQRSELFHSRSVDELERKSREILTRLQPLLHARGNAGLIRRGHGDLHLGNIAVLDGSPIAFDALEFDPIIAAGDVLYDLAFLLMDLVERGLQRSANIVLNGYMAATRRAEDCDGVAALRFFMSLRAGIRANVTVARLDLAAAKDRDAIAQAAGRYFDLALDLLASSKPVVVATGGLSGTGKSLLAKELAVTLAPVPGALVFRSDIERKALYNAAVNDRLPAEAYRAEVSDRIYRILTDKAERVARAGHSVIVDAVFAKADERNAIETAAARAGAAFRGLFLVADLPTRLARIGGRGPDASDADAAVARMQENFATDFVGWAAIDASGSPEQSLRNARAAIERDA